MARIDQTPFELDILDLSHDGRGVARRAAGHPNAGKTVFVAGALPGERVLAKQVARSRHFDEADTLQVLEASPERVAPRCAHFGVCGGCALQHLEASRQILAKQRVLLENFERIGHVAPRDVLPTLTGGAWHYRRKGRFSVRRVEKKDKTLVGFRERDPRFVADLRECHTVVPAVEGLIVPLSTLVDGLRARREIPQIEFIVGDPTPDFDGVALVLRHLQPLCDVDLAALRGFAERNRVAVFLQPGGVDSVRPLWPAQPALSFRLEPWNVTLAFRPLDFIQVNARLNEAMIARTFELLDLQAGDRVLDLFCGLGNFTLPMARVAAEVVGVEGEAALVARARENAALNGLDNATFHDADLTRDHRGTSWMRQGFDKLLLDPPRSGAIDVLKQLPLERFGRIVYVSCHPGSLARDASYLVNERGWSLRSAGAMDMFPQTAHVESIALFEKKP
ncbi:23S rRNA (uracil(1939)-C(5))-methyltransferase RlmD [Luteimonas saliphila]|uniref:23S rRNA (uracil(1939)-C(5))-methyltransferase RlmD n=1 Tax=Luteimonas saliphila TaxID=2804919 RepID=UPI00192DB101